MKKAKVDLTFRTTVEYDQDQIDKEELIITIAKSIYETINTPGIFDIENISAYAFVISIGGPIKKR